MENTPDTLSSKQSNRKVYKDKAIYAGTFLGGPLIAGYMLSENFKVFDEKEKVAYTWIITSIWTLIIFTIAYFLPDDKTSSKILLPLSNAIIAYSITQRTQGKNIAAYLQKGSQVYGWGRSLIVSLIGAIITIILIIPFLLAIDYFANNDLTTKVYGKMEHSIEYNADNISSSSVDSLAKMLTKTHFFDDYNQKYVYVKKIDDSYELYIPVVDKAVVKDFDFIREIRLFRVDLQSLYPNHKIVFNIVIDDIDQILMRIE